MVITLQEDADKLIVERKRERPQWFSRFVWSCSSETEVKAIIYTAGLSWRELERNLLEDMEL